MKTSTFVFLILITGGVLAFGLPRYLSTLSEGEATPPAPASPIIAANSGQELQLENGPFQIERLTCPAPDTEESAAALSALNAILQNSEVRCLVLDETTTRCFVKDETLTDAMAETGLCQKD